MSSKRSKAVERAAKVRNPRTPHWVKEGRRLARILAARNIGQTEFAERLGRKFHNVHRWCKGYEFTPDNQALAARELDLPKDAFESPSELKRRERETLAVLEQFTKLHPDVAASLSPEEWQVLRSIRFHDGALRPSVAFFQTVVAALQGAIRIDEIMSVAEENAALDEELAHKPPLRRRPT